MNVLVLYNSTVAESRWHHEYIVPYLDHFGVSFVTHDCADGEPIVSIDDYALVVISHPAVTGGKGVPVDWQSFTARILAAGAGMVSFDPLLPGGGGAGEKCGKPACRVG